MNDNYSISYKDKIFTPSIYQKKIFDNVKYGIGNMIIKACAGSGKTSVIVNLIKLIDKDKKLLFIAFNKEIVNELKKRIGLLGHIDIMTYHSLGYLILKENFGLTLKNVDEYKYRTYIKSNIKHLSIIDVSKLNANEYNAYISNIMHLINYSRYNQCQSADEIKKIGDKYGIAIMHDEHLIAEKALKWGQENISTIDYTDMIWLPIELNLYPKRYKYDWVLIDESQDISLIQQKLFLKTFKRGTRFVSVGDEYQTINLWAGASDTALNDLEKMPNTKVFTLPITYRCPKNIVELAKKYSDNIKADDNAIDGIINYDVSVNAPKSGDMVLCRNTAPLVELYMKYLRYNKKSYIKGSDIGKNLVNLVIENCDEIETLKNDFFNKLFEKLVILRDNLMKDYGLDYYDASSSPQIVNLYDNIMALKAISEGLNTKQELINKINEIFLDSDGDGVCLSTIHKAKGLEADNVFILCKSLMPSKLAKKEWEKITELNLIYVAITRAKKSLNFISENEFKPKSFFSKSDLFSNEINTIEKDINCNILKKDINTNDNNIITSNKIIKNKYLKASDRLKGFI